MRENCEDSLNVLEDSCFQKDIYCNKLELFSFTL